MTAQIRNDDSLIVECWMVSRFFLVSFLTYKYGEKFGPFLEKKGGKWSIILVGAVIILATIIYFFFKFYGTN